MYPGETGFKAVLLSRNTEVSLGTLRDGWYLCQLDSNPKSAQESCIDDGTLRDEQSLAASNESKESLWVGQVLDKVPVPASKALFR
jgi:hypothetical protein